MLDELGSLLDSRLIVVAAAVLFGGFLRGFVGFGGALVTVPVLSLVFGPRSAVAITGIIGFPTVFQLLPEAVRYSERPVVAPVCMAILLAAPVGAWILVSVDPKLMSMVISGLVVLMVGMLATGWTAKSEIGSAGLIGAGVAAGLLQGTAGIGGPPVVAIALARAGTPKQQRANVLAVMTAVAFSSIVPFWYLGLFTRQVLVAGIALLPLFFASTLLGSRYFSGGGQRHFRTAALTTLAAIGLATLLAAAKSYLAG